MRQEGRARSLEGWRDVVTEVSGARALDPEVTEAMEQLYAGLVILD